MKLTNVLQQVFIESSLSNRIAKTDWYQIANLPESLLSPEERRIVKRIRHSVRRGWIRVLDIAS